MRIAWISPASVVESSGRLDSAVGTARYRMLLPRRELEKLGHRVQVVNPFASLQRATQAALESDVVVLNKLMVDSKTDDFSHNIAAYDEILRRLPPAGPRVVFDVNDDHFDVPAFAAFYRSHLPHRWVTSSDEMARRLRETVSAHACVIPDPFEGPEGVPAPPLPTRFPALFRLLDRIVTKRGEGWRACLLWFGHPTGLPALAASLPMIAEAGRVFPLHLVCITAPGYGAENLVGMQMQKAKRALTMSFQAWSPEVTWRALRGCDLVVLPVDRQLSKARVKSANRMVEAVRAGRFAVAHRLPAYDELAEFAFVGDSLADGIVWALRHPLKVVERLTRGQQAIAERFSPEVVARQWLDAFRF